MKTASKTQGRLPASIIGSVYRTRRDLLRVTMGPEVLGDCKLSIEMVDILVDVYGAIKLNWPDPKAHHGHVTFRDLLDTTVHDSTLSDATLSLRLRRLKDMGLVVVKSIPQKGPAAELRSGPRGSRSWVRITDAGIKVAAPIWENYQKLSEDLLKGAPQEVLEHHFQLNAFISKRTQSRAISFEEVVRDLDRESRLGNANKT